MNLTDQELKTLIEIKDRGFAVVVITPEELEDADPNSVEDRLIELSWDIINDLKE